MPLDLITPTDEMSLSSGCPSATRSSFASEAAAQLLTAHDPEIMFRWIISVSGYALSSHERKTGETEQSSGNMLISRRNRRQARRPIKLAAFQR